MRGEIPQFKRCCFCVPLRRGLIGCGYAKMMFTILMIMYLSKVFFYVVTQSVRFDARDLCMMVFAAISLLFDVSLNIVFIIAGHKKSVKLLRISFIHNIVWLGLLVAINCFLLYKSISFMYRVWEISHNRISIVFDLLFCLGLAGCSIFIQIYLILLIRSERLKLLNKTLEMQFSNQAGTEEPQCKLHDAHAQAAQNCTDNDRDEAVITV